MAAADWGIPVPSGGMQVAPLRVPFQAQGDAIADALDKLRAMSVPSVASTAERAVLFPSPKQGDRVYRKDTAQEETYLGLYNASTNPGGALTAGWYATGGNLGFAENWDDSQSNVTGADWITTTPWGNAVFYSGAPQLVEVTVSAVFGLGTIGTPTDSGAVSFRAEGATTLDATPNDVARGWTPGVASTATLTRYVLVNAGTTRFRGYMTRNQGSSIVIRQKRLSVKGVGGAPAAALV